MNEHSINNSEIQTLVRQGLASIEAAASSQALQDVRVQFLGKSGSLAAHPYFQTIKDASPEQKKIIGADRTAATNALNAAIDARKAELEVAELNARLAKRFAALSTPSRRSRKNSLPFSRILVSAWRKAPRLRTTSTISARSTYPKATLRGRCTIPSI
jgi:phenylalanyl-tRNA synthetase alpha subunit